jgi:hypothetical protein
MSELFASALGVPYTDPSAELQALLPAVLDIFTKKDTFFDEPRVLFGVSLNDANHEVVWTHLPGAVLEFLTSKDIKELLNIVLSVAKEYMTANPREETDEISRLLNGPSTGIQEFLDYCGDTQLARVLQDLITTLDVTEFDDEVNRLLANPQEMVAVLRNPEHLLVKNIIHKLQTAMKENVRTGRITQHQIAEDVEGIKAKATGLFGSMFNSVLGGERSEVPSAVLLSNSPEARRQRMVARLQKKHREKNQH